MSDINYKKFVSLGAEFCEYLFGANEKFLNIASISCNVAAEYIRNFKPSVDLQEQIWSEDDLSVALMGSAESLNKAVLWQVRGARESHA